MAQHWRHSGRAGNSGGDLAEGVVNQVAHPEFGSDIVSLNPRGDAFDAAFAPESVSWNTTMEMFLRYWPAWWMLFLFLKPGCWSSTDWLGMCLILMLFTAGFVAYPEALVGGQHDDPPSKVLTNPAALAPGFIGAALLVVHVL